MAVPIVGCPAKGSSRAGVKMRTLCVALGSVAERTKTVSDRLNSRAIACIRPVDSPPASITTARGLPPKRSSVKTSSV
jgi:hypothetical protein